LRRHGKPELLNTIEHIQMNDKREKITELQHRIAQSERAVAGLQVEKVCIEGSMRWSRRMGRHRTLVIERSGDRSAVMAGQAMSRCPP